MNASPTSFVRPPASSSAPATANRGRGFADFDLRPELMRAVSELGFTEATPIQSSAIPEGLAGRDVLACAMTGSGKTAAFLLPILDRLATRPRGAVRALVLAPTRELAAQIVEHCQALARHTRLRAAAIHGGVAMGPQERALATGVDVIVACPGRLLDHLQYSSARFSQLEVLVLDEADRMLDMGFLPDIKRVLAKLPAAKQTMLFSATMPPEIAALAKQIQKAPAVIDVERPSAPASGVVQSIYEVRHDLKAKLLLGLLESDTIENAIVFTRTKHRANRLADFLERHGVECERIHGNRSQLQRTKALDGFKSGRYRVLVATDVAARGIDVEALSHVVNFDVPNVPEDYIHRVGRTARAGATGEALTFASREESQDLRAIERRVGKPIPRLRLEGFDYEGRAPERLEIPIAERLAAHRARRADERARSAARSQRAERQPAQRQRAQGPSSERQHSQRPSERQHAQRPQSERQHAQKPQAERQHAQQRPQSDRQFAQRPPADRQGGRGAVRRRLR